MPTFFWGEVVLEFELRVSFFSTPPLTLPWICLQSNCDYGCELVCLACFLRQSLPNFFHLLASSPDTPLSK
jgi:hypothetical protein